MARKNNLKNISWSEKEIRYLKELCKQPINLVTIANKVNRRFKKQRSTAAVMNFCGRNSIKRHGNLGISYWQPTKEIKKEIEKLISEGKSQTEISRILSPKTELKPKTLISYISKMGGNKFFNPFVRRKFTAMELEKIIGQRNSGISFTVLTNQYNIDFSTLKSIINRWTITRVNIIRDISAKVPYDTIIRKYVLTEKEYDMLESLSRSTLWNDSEPWSNRNGIEILDLIEKASKQFKSVNMRQSESLIQIHASTKYIGLLLSSDWHIGAASSDVERLRADLSLASKTPNLYIGLQGDLIDAYIPSGPHPGGINEQVVPAKMARRGAEALVELIKDKILWLTNSCHNLWTENAADYNHVEELCHKYGFSYLGHGGIVNLQILKKREVTRSWTLMAGHKYGSGGENAINACRQFLKKEASSDNSPDIIVFGHHHRNSILSEEFLGKRRTFVRSGQYKLQDRYADAMNVSIQKKDFGAPLVILGTDSDYMQPFNDMRKGVEVLGLLNRRKK